MPETTTRGPHLPELHLPEMTREDIARTLGDVRRDIAEAGRDIDLSGVDIPRVMATAVTAASLLKRGRSRLPFVIGALVAVGVVGWALATSPIVKPRLQELARRAKARIDERRASMDDASGSVVPETGERDVPAETTDMSGVDGTGDLIETTGSEGAIGAADGVDDAVRENEPTPA